MRWRRQDPPGCGVSLIGDLLSARATRTVLVLPVDGLRGNRDWWPIKPYPAKIIKIGLPAVRRETSFSRHGTAEWRRAAGGRIRWPIGCGGSAGGSNETELLETQLQGLPVPSRQGLVSPTNRLKRRLRHDHAMVQSLKETWALEWTAESTRVRAGDLEIFLVPFRSNRGGRLPRDAYARCLTLYRDHLKSPQLRRHEIWRLKKQGGSLIIY